MIHLFKAYLVVSDRPFVSSIKLKKMEYKQGRNRLLSEKLMTLAINKYAILHTQILWNTKTLEEERAIVPTGKVQKLSDTNLKLAKSLTEKKGKSSEKYVKKNHKWAWKNIPPK